jgi:hypothetical protein
VAATPAPAAVVIMKVRLLRAGLPSFACNVVVSFIVGFLVL